ncbi:MAG: VOC family protein [Stackebrandtia sp.]
MSTMIFPNLPVKDLDAAKKFYTSLGFELNEEFSDDNAASIVISDTIAVMLVTEKFFANFTTRGIADTSTTVESLHALGVENRERVDGLADAALAAGGTVAGETMDDEFMYSRGFHDLDGHHWNVWHMNLG